jgi:hypothetical protein
MPHSDSSDTEDERKYVGDKRRKRTKRDGSKSKKKKKDKKDKKKAKKAADKDKAKLTATQKKNQS